MSKERQIEINLRSRKNQGRKMRTAVAEDLARKLSISADSIRFLSLEETDKLYSENSYKRVFSEQAVQTRTKWRYVYTDQMNEIDAVIHSLESTLQDKKITLLLEDSRFTGGAEVSLQNVLLRYEHLVDLDGDDLVAVSLDNSFGLMIENFTDRTEEGAKEVFRLSTWFES